MAKQPIGIFDSGVGGLNIAKAISELTPNEDLLYIGDTAHCPWGDKSAISLQHYAHKICEILHANQCKAIVVACNTASATVLQYLKEKFNNIPIFNVIDPVIDFIKCHNFQHIGAIGTKQTINSNAYQRQLKNLPIKTTSLATPLLAPMIEEGSTHDQIAKMVIAKYLSAPNLQNINALILGCTHYPLIIDTIYDFYQTQHKKVTIIDPTALIAKQVQKFITEAPCQPTTMAHNKFFLTDNSEFFARIANQFFPSKLQLRLLDLWS